MKAFLASLALLGTLLSGCANPCGDLKTQCDNCTGTAGASAGKAACLLTHSLSLGNPQTCQAVLDGKTYAAGSVACK